MRASTVAYAAVLLVMGAFVLRLGNSAEPASNRLRWLLLGISVMLVALLGVVSDATR